VCVCGGDVVWKLRRGGVWVVWRWCGVKVVWRCVCADLCACVRVCGWVVWVVWYGSGVEVEWR
jgi:hypothetical protein